MAPEHHRPDYQPREGEQAVDDQSAERAHQQFEGPGEAAAGEEGYDKEQGNDGSAGGPFDLEPEGESEGNSGDRIVDTIAAVGEDEVAYYEWGVDAQ